MASKKKKQPEKPPAPEVMAEKAVNECVSPDKSVLSDERAEAYHKLITDTMSHYKQKVIPRMKRLRSAYETGADKDPGSDIIDKRIRVPIILPATQAKIAAIYPKNPDVTVKPRRKTFIIQQPGGQQVEMDGEDAADRIKTLVDYDVRELEVDEEVFMALTDADVIGYGAVRCGWDAFAETEENTEKDADGTAKLTGEDLAESTVELDSADSSTYKQEIDLRYDPKIAEEQPWAQWIPAEDVLFPPFIKDIRRSPWMIIKERRSSEEVKADRRLKLPSNFDAHTSKLLSEDDKNNLVTELSGPNDVAYVDQLDMWNKMDNTHAIFINGIASPVFVEKWPYAAKGYPVKLVSFYHNPRGGLPISPTGLVLPQQNEKNIIRTRMNDHVAKWQSKVLVDSTVSDEELNRFKSAPDGGLVTVEDIRKYLQVNPAPMPKEWLAYDQITDRDIDVIGGVPDFQRSGGGDDSKFASVALLQAQGASTRVNRYKNKANRFFIEIVTYLFQLRQQFMTKQVELVVTGSTGFTYHQVNPDHIQGNYEFEVNVDSSGATDVQRDAETGKMMLTMFPEILPFTNPEEYLDRVFKYLRIPNRHALIKQAEDLEAMRAAEYEDTLMSMGVDVHPDQKENLAAHILVHSQTVTGIKQLIQSGQVESPQKGQMMLASIQKIQAHIAETAAMMDKTGTLKTAIQPGQPGTPEAGGKLRADVKQPGAGQGAQPDNMRQGSQQANAQKPGSGMGVVTRVQKATQGA